MTMRRAIAVFAFVASIGGCGGAQRREAQAPTLASESAAGQDVTPEGRRQEILRLEQQIEARTAAVPHEESQDAGVPNAPGVSRTPGTEPGASCEQACQATGSICQAASRICSLAEEMDDEWAKGRCRAASRTCTDVRRRASNACGTC